MLVGEALGERRVLAAAGGAWVLRETDSERANVVVVKRVALAQIVSYSADEVVGDALGAHRISVRLGAPTQERG